MDGNSKILLVDDESDFREFMEKLFQLRKLDCATAPGCMEALELLDQDKYDVVVMDISMPGLGGLECMAEVKKLHPDIEVIILTGHASLQGGISSIKKGAFDYCMKPVDYDELLEKIILARERVLTKRSGAGK